MFLLKQKHVVNACVWWYYVTRITPISIAPPDASGLKGVEIRLSRKKPPFRGQPSAKAYGVGTRGKAFSDSLYFPILCHFIGVNPPFNVKAVNTSGYISLF